jgi:hypothetical protein
MEEIIDGVFHWKAVHPRIKIEVGCHFVAGSGTAIDPLLPDEGIEWFDDRGLRRIVLSTRHHLRHAPELAERFGWRFEHLLFAHGDPRPDDGREALRAIAGGS